jgi:hypothetical protein
VHIEGGGRRAERKRERERERGERRRRRRRTLIRLDHVVVQNLQ